MKKKKLVKEAGERKERGNEKKEGKSAINNNKNNIQ